MADRFWEQKDIFQFTDPEWEQLCDGCAKCCLQKLEDEDTAEVVYTKVVCRYMDEDNCQCTEYQARSQLVPNCVKLRPEDVADFHWLPSTCAYRLIAEGQPLFPWHHLLSGSRDTVHAQGVSVKGRVLSEAYVHPDGLDEHIIHWVE